MNNKRVIKLILLILWMALIFVFSNQNGDMSTNTSDTFLYQIVELVTHNKLSDSDKIILTKEYMFIVRKCAHFFLYFVLGVLIFISLKDKLNINYKLILFTIFGVLLYAISDEIHQLFVPKRAGTIKDVLIDTTGGTTSTLLCYLLNILKIKRKITERKLT